MFKRKQIVKLTILLVILAASSARAQDAFPIQSAQIVNAPDVSAWPATATITRLKFDGSTTAVSFTKQWSADRWPDVVPPGWDGPLQYTLWLFVQQNGQWVGSGFVQFWFGRNHSGEVGDPDVPSRYHLNYYYAPRWRPISEHGPIRPGESIGFMVTSGNARDGVGPYGPMERSNIVIVPAADVADYTFSSAPPVVPPPVVIVPPAPPIVSPPPVIVSPPPPIVPPGPVVVDYTELLKQLLATQQAQLALEQDTNKQITELRRSWGETVGRVFGFIGKYIAPAAAAWIAARQLNP